MGFSEQLKKARQNNKLTQQQVANILGIDVSTYCGYEIGKRKPDVKKIKKLAKALNVSADFLLETGFEKTNIYSLQEKELLDKYKKLNKRDKTLVDTILNNSEEEYTKKQYLKIARGGQKELVSSKDIDEMIEQGEQVFSDDDL